MLVNNIMRRYQLLYCECVVCKAELLPPIEPPHCEYCIPSDQMVDEWEAEVDQLDYELND